MSGMEISKKDAQYAEAKRVTQVGTGGDTLLTFGKLIIGYWTGSAALVAEGFHSGADLLFDLVVLVGMKIARKKPDEDHPYGHGKFEGLISLLLAVILLLVAVGVVVDAVQRMKEGNLQAPGQLAFWAALISIVTKEALFHYTVRVGRKLKSNIIMANAWHHRADSISSLAALLGIGGALMGYPILDPIAAIAVAFFVSKVGFEIGRDAVKELTDASDAVDAEIREQINQLIHEIPEVLSAHFVSPRQLGPDIIVDVHVEVPLSLSVSEGHQVAELVRQNLLKHVEAISEVVVHVDTEDDMEQSVLIHAGRKKLHGWVRKELLAGGAVVDLQRLQAHYSREGIHLDLVLVVDALRSWAEIQEDSERICQLLLESEHNIAEIRAAVALTEKHRPGLLVRVAGHRHEAKKSH
ncbi:cation diffusion facilitator family transporter [Candidatus Magnetaquicoccus inordinatus]|uniref:cation diffusion facilitator family transporter n=1 Tax=Candidatus Magnetaquicoccus inordinatus TaxID=2496818 RepID=UPI00102BA7F7|nr:cation diffusion facilitator family transporter [Candidatus Magnetaquicoccus inordinatus]